MSRFLLAHAGHLLFIPDLVDYHVPQTGIYELFPSNGPLWSIFFEFVASVCFIWFARIPRKGLWLYSLLSFAVLLAGCYYVMLTTGRALSPGVGFSPATFYLGFPRVFGAFFAGMAIYALTQEGRQPIIHSSPLLQSSALTLAVYTLISAVLLFPDPLSGIYPFLAIIVFCPALIALGGILAPEARWLRASSDYLGQLSFPLYCVHEPVRVLVTTHFSNMSWSLQILLAFGLAMAFSAFVLLVFDWLRVRQNLSAILKPVTG
jgi:peptidoglycan/LPS O-acetylase OafA/YrhL